MARRAGLSERERFWREHIGRCEGSGQTLAAYAKTHDLKVGALYEAKSRLRRKGALAKDGQSALSKFVRVTPPAVTPAAPMLCRVRLPNAVTLELGCAPEQWEALLASLARLR